MSDKVTNPNKDDRKPNQDKLLNKLREILKREKREFKNLDEEIDGKLNRLVKAIKLSPEAEAFLPISTTMDSEIAVKIQRSSTTSQLSSK